MVIDLRNTKLSDQIKKVNEIIESSFKETSIITNEETRNQTAEIPINLPSHDIRKRTTKVNDKLASIMACTNLRKAYLIGLSVA